MSRYPEILALPDRRECTDLYKYYPGAGRIDPAGKANVTARENLDDGAINIDINFQLSIRLKRERCR
jgi:hypothetical protein